MTNGNDSAFARPASEFTMNGTLPDGNDAINETNGLTKREYFAGLAMQGAMTTSAHPNVPTFKGIAEMSVKAADALIAELSRPTQEEGKG